MGHGIAAEVKAEILSKVKSGESVPKLSREYGISDNTIYTWLKVGTEHASGVLEANKLRKENDQLKQIIGILTLELEKSKKKSRWYPEAPNRSLTDFLKEAASSAFWPGSVELVLHEQANDRPWGLQAVSWLPSDSPKLRAPQARSWAWSRQETSQTGHASVWFETVQTESEMAQKERRASWASHLYQPN